LVISGYGLVIVGKKKTSSSSPQSPSSGISERLDGRVDVEEVRGEEGVLVAGGEGQGNVDGTKASKEALRFNRCWEVNDGAGFKPDVWVCVLSEVPPLISDSTCSGNVVLCKGLPLRGIDFSLSGKVDMYCCVGSVVGKGMDGVLGVVEENTAVTVIFGIGFSKNKFRIKGGGRETLLNSENVL